MLEVLRKGIVGVDARYLNGVSQLHELGPGFEDEEKEWRLRRNSH